MRALALERWLLAVAYAFRTADGLAPIGGGAPDGDGGDGKGGDGDGAGDGDGDGDGGDGGDGDGGDGDGDGNDDDLEDADADTLRAAIRKEREKTKRVQRDAKKATKDLRTLRRDIEKMKAEAGTEEEKKIAAAKDEAAKETAEKLAAPIKRAAIREAAAGRLNPSVAVRLVPLDDIEVDEDGNVDADTVKDAIDALLEEAPELAIKSKGGKSGGDTGNGKPPGTKTPKMEELLRASIGAPMPD